MTEHHHDSCSRRSYFNYFVEKAIFEEGIEDSIFQLDEAFPVAHWWLGNAPDAQFVIVCRR